MRTHTLCKYICNRVNPLIGVIGVLTILTGCGEHSFEEWLGLNSSSSEEADDLSSSSGSGGSGQGIVEPLLQTKWSQNLPYATKLRELAAAGVGDIGDLTKGICGIVGWSQIMRYHKHPARGIGKNDAWTHSNGTNLPSVNFEVSFDWDNMLYTYNSSATDYQRNTVAELYYIISIGRVDGNYSKTVNSFGYDKRLQRIYRKYYSDAEWEAIIRAQLDAGLPIGYQGRGNANHFFVIDGYDNAGKFHVNWGWGNSSDGWYSLNNLNPGTLLFDNYNGHSMFINFMPDKGGVPAPYEMALNNFTASKATVPQNELFTVEAQLRNNSASEAFPGGQLGVALVNNIDNTVKVIGVINYSALSAGATRTSTINCFVPETVNPGQHKLRMVTKVEGENWKLVERSAVGEGIQSSINLTLTAGEAKGGGYGLSLENFAPEKTSASQNGTFKVEVKTRNVGVDEFSGGQLGVALVNSSGSMEVIKTATWNSLNSNATRTGTLSNCTIPATVPLGQYKLRIVIKPTGGDEWRVATLSLPDVQSSIVFRVE